MTRIAYYVIRPTHELSMRLESAPADIAEELNETSLWSKQEGGRSLWSEADHVLCVKLMFLIHVLRFYSGGLAEPIVQSLLGTAPYTSATFDRWWTITRLEVSVEFADCVDGLTRRDFESVSAPESDRVAKWLSEAREKSVD